MGLNCSTNQYHLGKRSLQRLQGVHIDLINVVKRAIELTEVDFSVLEGVRTVARQRALFTSSASKTMHSRHLTGHAVDLGAYINGRIEWSWPLYRKIAKAMKQSACELTIQLEWGGDWQTFKDGAHFQLPWFYYPETTQSSGKPQ